jgi:hypothetical protein
MSAARPQSDPAAIRGAASDFRLPADVKERVQRPPAELSASTTHPPTSASTPAVVDGVAPALLVALLQEYAIHQAPIAQIQRKRRQCLLCGVLSGFTFLVFVVLNVPGLAASGSELEPTLFAGLIASGIFTPFLGFVWCAIILEERYKLKASEKGKADVIRRLLAAFPQPQGTDAKALLSGKAAQGIIAAHELEGVALPRGTAG